DQAEEVNLLTEQVLQEILDRVEHAHDRLDDVHYRLQERHQQILHEARQPARQQILDRLLHQVLEQVADGCRDVNRVDTYEVRVDEDAPFVGLAGEFGLQVGPTR